MASPAHKQMGPEREAGAHRYAEAQRFLAEGNFSLVLEICKEALEKSSGDPLFLALQLEAEERQRQEQSAFIAEVSRRAEAEHDLDRRVNILTEAVERYPAETHLQQALRLVCERRDLVNAIVERARKYEESGQLNEALNQFDILRSIYAQYPGIEVETERLKRRCDTQIQNRVKQGKVEEIEHSMADGEYARAQNLVRTALAEFPDDAELLEWERRAAGALQGASDAEEWFQRGQSLWSDGQFGDALAALGKAASLDSRDAIIRTVFLNALLERARSVLADDWRAAESLIEQALQIESGHPLAKSLQPLVEDYKREEALQKCVTQARGMQADGDLSGALARVEEVLADYPDEARLVRLRTTLIHLGASPAVKISPSPPQIPPPPAAESAPAPSPAEWASTETLVMARDRSGLTNLFTLDRSMAAGAAAAVQPARAPEEVQRPPSRPARLRGKTVPQQAREQFARFWKMLQDFAAPTRRGSKLQWGLMILASSILLLGLAVTYSRNVRKSAAPPAPSEYLVDVQSNVVTAKYRVDGQTEVALPWRLRPGAHTVEAIAPGYKPSKQSFTLEPKAPRPYVVAFSLVPELVKLRLSSDLRSGQVSLDGQAAVDLQDGGFMNDAISLSTEHTFSLLQAGEEVVSFSFGAEAGGAVALSTPVKTKSAAAVVISMLGSRARVYANDKSLKAGLTDQALQSIPPQGLEFRDLASNCELVLENRRQTLPLEISNVPLLRIWVSSTPAR